MVTGRGFCDLAFPADSVLEIVFETVFETVISGQPNLRGESYFQLLI